jgi:peroxiredoxin
MPLSKGDAAPDFTLPTHEMKRWSLSEDGKGKKTVLLFFPGAFTSVCTTELNDVQNDMARYDGLGAQIVGVSTDSPFVLAEFKQANNLSFPLLSDHDGDVSKAYGAKYDGDFTDMKLSRISKRSAFVVDEDGTLLYAEVLENAGKQPDFEAIRSALGA